MYLAATPAAQEPSRAGANWFSYGGDPGGTRYSSLSQITKANVSQLKEVWRFETPDPGRLQTTPLVVDGTMYVVTPRQKVIALDAATGRQKWTFDSGVGTTAAVRGLTWWTDGKESRLFSAAANFLYAINPADGKAITTFGKDGRIDLRENLPGAAANNGYHATSPAVVYKDLLILGGRVSERTPAPPGDQRAYDVRTGQLRWSFHTIPAPGEPGSETWPPNANPREKQGGANAWAGTIVDTQRGIVFIATGSPADDFYGVDRPGDNLYGNCVIALDANTGKKLWHFQATRHDLWDSDFTAPPILLTVNSNGRRVDAVAATNKWGFIYIFDRVTGKPLFPIKEVKAPTSTVPGEITSPTQPVPTLPAPLAKQTMTRDEVTTRTPEMRAWAQKEFDTFLGTNQMFTPLSIDKQTMVAPGWKGGVEWGGVTVDPDRGILYANVNNVFSLGSLTAAGNAPPRRGGGAADDGAAPAAPSALGARQTVRVHRISLLPGSRGVPGQCLPLGHAQRGRHEHGEVPLDRAVRRAHGACREGADRDRRRQPRRHGDDVHRRAVCGRVGVRLQVSSVRQRHGQGPVDRSAAWSRCRITGDLLGQRQAVCRDRREPDAWRGRQGRVRAATSPHERHLRGVRSALTGD